VRAVLLSAARELALPAQAPTLQELAAHTQVGLNVARRTLDNLRRHGHVRIVRERVVAYRNRPVAEYEPVVARADAAACHRAGLLDLSSVMHGAWR